VINQYNTNPIKEDTEDGLSDGREVNELSTEPNRSDSDNDGLNDSWEIQQDTDPLSKDSDSDGLNDGKEVNQYNTDPTGLDSLRYVQLLRGLYLSYTRP
jgi:hypothetical protein